MNVRKPIDYSEMYAELDRLMAAELSQMELYCAIGKLVSSRPEKGAAVAASEYLQEVYPNAVGISPRNLRRMREFYNAYQDVPDLLALAVTLGWTQNVVIMEAGLSMEEQAWYMRAACHYGWSKLELMRQINACAHLEIFLDCQELVCYNESIKAAQENGHDEDTFRVSWEYLQKPHGRVCYEGSGAESGPGKGLPDRVRCDQHRGDRQPGLSSGEAQAGRAWNQLHRENCTTASERRLRGIRSVDWHGSDKPPQYVSHLRRGLRGQDAPPDGVYRPPRRCCRPVVHRRFRCDLAGCGGRLSEVA